MIRVHSWQCTEIKSVDDVTEVDDANTIHRESTPEEHTIGEVLPSQSKEEDLNAKLNELKQWKSRRVYTEIEVEGQECIFRRWVIKSKLIDNKPGTKAQLCARGFVPEVCRLCARDFEEEQNFRTDSPTWSRTGIPTMFCFIASRKFILLTLKPHFCNEMS